MKGKTASIWRFYDPPDKKEHALVPGGFWKRYPLKTHSLPAVNVGCYAHIQSHESSAVEWKKEAFGNVRFWSKILRTKYQVRKVFYVPRFGFSSFVTEQTEIAVANSTRYGIYLLITIKNCHIKFSQRIASYNNPLQYRLITVWFPTENVG